MKTLKILGLSALVIMSFYSCNKTGHEPVFVVYNLSVSFTDADGNDLVNGIGLEEWSAGTSMENAQWGTVIPDLYVLDIIVSEPCENWDNEIYNAPARPGFEPDVNRPKLGMERYNDGDCYLTNRFSLPVNDCPEQRILTYKLKNPYVFGDEVVREFVAYWNVPKTRASGHEYFAECYRIEFEGNVITPITMDKNRNYMAVIMLNYL